MFIISISLLHLKAQNFKVITGKSVVIEGQTSFGKFSCHYQTHNKADTIYFESSERGKHPVLSIHLPVEAFGCGNKMLNRDFSKTLKSDEYPIIQVWVDRFFKRDGRYFSSLRLKLVGKELYMEELAFKLEGDENDKVLSATFGLDLQYFDLEPPKKLLGLLKVHNELNIDLRLNLLESEVGK